MQRKARDVESALLRKGFKKTINDHYFFTYVTLDRKVSNITTKISLGEREIHSPLISKMAKDCKLTKDAFLNLVDCPLDQEHYDDILKEQGLI